MSSWVLTVPVLSTVVGLSALVTATRIHLPVAAVVLGTLTLVVSAGRAQLSFHQLRRTTELHRLAMTDDLTNLANRRTFTTTSPPRWKPQVTTRSCCAT